MQIKRENLRERDENIKKEEEKLKKSILKYNKFLQVMQKQLNRHGYTDNV